MSWVEKLRTSPKMVLFVVSFALLVEEVLYGAVAPLTPMSPAKLSDEHMISTLYGAYALGLILAAPVLALITDRIGRRQPMIVGALLLTVSSIMFLVGNNVEIVFASRVLQGAGAACTWTAGLALVAEYFHKDRVRAMGFALLGGTIGAVAGPLIGGEMYDLFGFAIPMYLMIALLVLDLLLRFVFISPKQLTKAKGTWKHTFIEVGGIVTDKSVLSAAFAVSLAAAGWALMEPLFPMHVQHIAKASPSTVGALFTFSNLIYAFLPPVVSFVSDRIGTRHATVLGLVVTAVSMPLLALTPNLFLATVVLCLITVGYAFTMNPTSAELGDAVDRRGSTSYAIAYAVSNLSYSLGMIAVDLYVEFVTDKAHKLELFDILLIISALFLLCIPLFLAKVTTKENLDNEETEQGKSEVKADHAAEPDIATSADSKTDTP
jgi:DHA1 family solute carrier family 18 vesicular amine transporter 1/2